MTEEKLFEKIPLSCVIKALKLKPERGEFIGYIYCIFMSFYFEDNYAKDYIIIYVENER